MTMDLTGFSQSVFINNFSLMFFFSKFFASIFIVNFFLQAQFNDDRPIASLKGFVFFEYF